MQAMLIQTGHPSLGKHWIPAGLLQPDDSVQTATGSSAVTHTASTQQTTQMYNLDVEETDTFYVGEAQWLVHNCPAPDVSVFRGGNNLTP
jgi:hypothetical protein